MQTPIPATADQQATGPATTPGRPADRTARTRRIGVGLALILAPWGFVAPATGMGAPGTSGQVWKVRFAR